MNFFNLWALRVSQEPYKNRRRLDGGNSASVIVSGVEKLTRSSLKGVSNRALFAYKNGRFASSFLLLGIGFLEASKKDNLSFKSPSPKPHSNRTGSVFALPIVRREYHQSCAQPGFPAEKKRCHFWASSAYFPVFGEKKGRKKARAQPRKKTCAQPWYARKSGKSPGQNRGLVEINLWASKTHYLKAFQSLGTCLDYSTITRARFALHGSDSATPTDSENSIAVYTSNVYRSACSPHGIGGQGDTDQMHRSYDTSECTFRLYRSAPSISTRALLRKH